MRGVSRQKVGMASLASEGPREVYRRGTGFKNMEGLAGEEVCILEEVGS